jgi:uncharacterized protein
MADTATLEILDKPERNRFEARLEGELVGLIDYIPLPGKIIATHTEVAERYKGQGFGARLVQGMIDQLRADGRLLQPLCPYVAAYLRRHPDEADVVDRSTPS